MLLSLFIRASLCGMLIISHRADAAKSLVVHIREQKIFLYSNKQLLRCYAISTSGWGIGNETGSNKTPLGKHRIHKKIGTHAPIGTIFKSSINTKRLAPIFQNSVARDEQEDLITTRIIQLEGLEECNNNSFKRGIWIHGTPYEGDVGRPCSHGCIRMRNKDIRELFDQITEDMMITISQ